MQSEDIDNRFTYHPPTSAQVPIYEEVRTRCRELAHWLNDIVPEGREQSLAVTHLEETVFWANAGIARQALPDR
jgi:hypothetical protein